jgi:hypothetical protein
MRAFAFRTCHALTALLPLLVVISCTGCVERLLQVRSDPPGAKVYVNGEAVGTTPCDHEFSFYGTVDVTLRAPGYLSHREIKTLSPPWYQFIPIDLFTDLLLPFTIHDVHTVSIALKPSPDEVSPALRRSLDRDADAMRALLRESTTASSSQDPAVGPSLQEN